MFKQISRMPRKICNNRVGKNIIDILRTFHVVKYLVGSHAALTRAISYANTPRPRNDLIV